nr:hypothetical protein [Roseovarius aestuarii]
MRPVKTLGDIQSSQECREVANPFSPHVIRAPTKAHGPVQDPVSNGMGRDEASGTV